MDGLAAMDPKTQLNSFCQQYLGRNVNNRYDVIYDSGWIASKHMWQATVRLACMDGDPTFAGHSDPDRRIAEHNAVKQLERLNMSGTCHRIGPGKTCLWFRSPKPTRAGCLQYRANSLTLPGLAE
eukprot:TRINITY_DN14430_c0_g1_i5.p2 TRINITY_DN14430_c0_g1~~TRINITY_DN14430_c0_g1_i5.p2  ORF type:complete len:125 (-),score=0.50 TRINITY_DN14430_c0_g1_i5:564-938(-)